MLLSSMRHTSATTQYVSSYLQRQGIDSFTLEYLQIKRPFVFRLSVARDIEPVVSWLRSVGCGGEKLVDLVRHAPGILSASVDEQLEPLAALVQEAGGRPHDVLLACPSIIEVPVGQLAAARLVLQQMGASEGGVSQLLLRAPDLYVQLTQTLQHLFSEWMQQQHMSPWNRSKWTAAAAPGSRRGHSSTAAHDAAAQPPDFLLQAKRLHGCQVHRCLLRVLAALDALKLQGAVERDALAEAAAAHLQLALDELERALLDEQHATAHVVCA